jgi:ubiquinone/menaquinone biosynthesis C-methylase UbiE
VAALRNAIRCDGCGALYDIVEGIPALVTTAGDEIEHEASSQRQREYFDREDDSAFEVTRPHGTPRLHRWLLSEKFRRSVSELRPILAGAVVVSVCGGSGMDAEFLARAGARVVLVDISLGAAKRARERALRFGLPIVPVVGDVMRLPLADDSVDLAYVHDGLHHVDRPLEGLTEMCRVARCAVSINEPARATVTAAAVKVGLALEREEAGNVVARLTVGEIESELERQGFHVARAERYGMYYRHHPGHAVRWLSVPGAFELAKVAFNVLNRVGGRFGNKLTVQAVRSDEVSAAQTARDD